MKYRQRKVKINYKISKPKTISKFEVKFNENDGDSEVAKCIFKISAAMFGLVVLFSLGLRASCYYEDFHGEKTVAQVFSDFKQHFGDILQVLELHTEQKDADYLEKLLNARLRPIQCRLTSLRSQIKDHETILYIQKLSEPPLNFIHGTKLELENFGIELLELDTKVGCMLGEMLRKSTKTLKLAARLVAKSQKIKGLSSPWKLNLLQREGIFLVPIKWITELELSRKELEDMILKEGKNKNQTKEELVEEIVETRKILGNMEQLFIKRDEIEKQIFFLMGKSENKLSKLTRDQLLDKAYDDCARDLFFIDGKDLIFDHDSIENEITEAIKGSEKFLHNVLLLEWKTSLKIFELAKDHSSSEHTAGKLQYFKLRAEVEKNMLNLLGRVEVLGQGSTFHLGYDIWYQ